jgi:hypothetical protein
MSNNLDENVILTLVVQQPQEVSVREEMSVPLTVEEKTPDGKPVFITTVQVRKDV